MKFGRIRDEIGDFGRLKIKKSNRNFYSIIGFSFTFVKEKL